MPLIDVARANPFVDGRQSQRAMEVRAGVERHYREQGWATLPEVTLSGGRRADLLALSPKGDVTIVEIKSSVADLRADAKWPDYRAHCDELVFATLRDVPADIFPEDAGLMVADAYGAHRLRPGPVHRLSAHGRKKIHLRFARAAALRLARCCEHAGVDATDFRDEAA